MAVEVVFFAVEEVFFAVVEVLAAEEVFLAVDAGFLAAEDVLPEVDEVFFFFSKLRERVTVALTGCNLLYVSHYAAPPFDSSSIA